MTTDEAYAALDVAIQNLVSAIRTDKDAGAALVHSWSLIVDQRGDDWNYVGIVNKYNQPPHVSVGLLTEVVNKYRRGEYAG